MTRSLSQKDIPLPDPTNLIMIGIGALVASVGFIGRRMITGAKSQETLARYASLTEIGAKMKAHGLAPADIQAIDGFVRRKGREQEIATGGSLGSSRADPAATPEPDGYWTQYAMNVRATASLATAQAQLNESLLELEHYVGEALEPVQASWEAFRDRQIELVAAEYVGGSIAPLIKASEAEELTRQRLAWAQAYIEELRSR